MLSQEPPVLFLRYYFGNNSQGQTCFLTFGYVRQSWPGKIPVSVVGKFHLICFQLGQQQHQNLDEYKENDLQHTLMVVLKETYPKHKTRLNWLNSTSSVRICVRRNQRSVMPVTATTYYSFNITRSHKTGTIKRSMKSEWNWLDVERQRNSHEQHGVSVTNVDLRFNASCCGS